MREQDFVQAARSLGARSFRIMLRHLLPNLLSPMVIIATLQWARVILLESALSFLRLGVPPPVPSWGGMLADGRTYMASVWWLVTMPGVAIASTVLGMNLMGDGLRDYLDPRLKKTSPGLCAKDP